MIQLLNFPHTFSALWPLTYNYNRRSKEPRQNAFFQLCLNKPFTISLGKKDCKNSNSYHLFTGHVRHVSVVLNIPHLVLTAVLTGKKYYDDPHFTGKTWKSSDEYQDTQRWDNSRTIFIVFRQVYNTWHKRWHVWENMEMWKVEG